jgi:hypothetical protein
MPKAVREGLQVGVQVSFDIAFNLRGPLAINLRLVDLATGSGAVKGAQLLLPLQSTPESNNAA